MKDSHRTKCMACLQLMRAPNLFTAVADILAGYFVVAGSALEADVLFFLALSSSSIYAAGCVMNDIHDREVDGRERPFRPIPSGKVSVTEARFLLAVLFGIGLTAAALAGPKAFPIAAGLILLVVIYDTRSKHTDTLGPLNMAACRSLNLLLGMSPALSFRGTVVFFPLLTLFYVFSLTTLSRFEVEGGMGAKCRIVLGGWCITMLGMAVASVMGGFSAVSFLFLALLISFTGPKLYRALRTPEPEFVGAAVKALVLGIPLLDAVYAAAAQGGIFGAVTASCLIPSILLARKLYVT